MATALAGARFHRRNQLLIRVVPTCDHSVGNRICSKRRRSSAWDAINGRRPFGPFTLITPLAEIHWPEKALVHEGLVQIAPGIGSLVGRAVAIA